MSYDLLIILIVIVSGFALLSYLLNRKQSSQTLDQALTEWLKTMQQEVTNTNSNIVKTLQENSRQLNDRLDHAAIETDAGILPIDSKFPMENCQKMVKAENKTEKDSFKKEFIRDVKKHIDDISKKYILPEEGTMDFCLMYIPSEPVYYEVADNPEVLDYARRKRVYAVSPTTLYAHLQVILLSFEGKKIESR